MLRNVKWSPNGIYISHSDYEPVRFFSEALANAKTFDLFLGFFSSSAISVLSDGFAIFLGTGGKMRLIVNEFLSDDDKEAFKGKDSTFFTPNAFSLRNLKDLKANLNKRDRHFFECLSWLISENRIEIKVVTPKTGQGISHPKSGIFDDGHNGVAFDGSCNFSENALVYNIEQISIFCDWICDVFRERVTFLKENFEKVFAGENPNYRIIPIHDLEETITTNFPKKKLEVLLEDEMYLKSDTSQLPENIDKQLTEVRGKLMELIKEKEKLPHFPFIQGPRDYQETAYQNWIDNGRNGLFAMATGTGKTITALNCLLELSRQTGDVYKALILVPTIELAKQWEIECRKFNFQNVFIPSGSADLKKRVSTLLQYEKEKLSNVSYIIICTYATYQKPKNFELLNQLSPTELLFIADEAHNLGAAGTLNKLENVQTPLRIGLSATPERPYEEETNEKVLDFFKAREAPTFEFSMAKAIEDGILSRYFYFPHLVHLTPDEMEEYSELTSKIAKLSHSFKQKDKKSNQALEALLLKRKRIINKASNKLAVFQEAIHQIYQKEGQLDHCLVYVPEGSEEESEESRTLIDQFTLAVRELNDHITVSQFVSQTEERKKLLADFANGDINVLTSMKCLDEGIDIPAAKTAIICASSENPRQYIQRRGRVLRQFNGQFAQIHDLVVVPPLTGQTEEEREHEKRLLEKELKRAVNFAMLAVNQGYIWKVLKPVLEEYKISIARLM